MERVPTRIPDVVLFKPRVLGDSRGYFMETWRESEFAAAGLPTRFVQDNHSHSVQWTLRGLHYQVRQPQGKIVRVSRGAVYDVAVDLRRGSATFGRWVGVELSEANHHMLWIPPGFAHGFLALTPTADCVYKCTEYYQSEFDRVLLWNDPELGIDWPLPAGVIPRLSARDLDGTPLRAAECL